MERERASERASERGGGGGREREGERERGDVRDGASIWADIVIES